MLDIADTRLETAGGDNSPAYSRAKVEGIAILGSHPATVEQAPFGDESWTIYACSPHNVERRTLPRVDQWFEVHKPLEDPTRAFGYLLAVSQMPFVWLRDERALPYFKGGRLYPEKELRGTSSVEKRKVKMPDGSVQVALAEIPNMDGLFCPYMFTSSIAYMLAKAIVDCEEHGIPQIGLWGIMQASENEYTYQRPGIQYFIQQAMSRGIKVVAPRESCLFDMPQWKW